ncbi:MAG: hypothetical protein IKM05_00585 [Clostridia bacterium]|nr:hypothetical protein [Clostridia bacterium]
MQQKKQRNALCFFVFGGADWVTKIWRMGLKDKYLYGKISKRIQTGGKGREGWE